MRLVVIGAGLMGRAALSDLANSHDIETLGIYDIDGALADEINRKFGSGNAVAGELDATDEDKAASVLAEFDAAIACTTFRHNLGLTRAAVRAGCHLVDLGGNSEVVRAQLEVDEEAEKAGIIIIPDCGLAPGMVAVMVADAVARFDVVNSVRIRVGGLPQSPRPPLNYRITFSVEGLINEYWEPCTILEEGRIKTVNPMTGLEQLEFDGVGKLEAFYTSGGTSTLPDTYNGQIEHLDYKTIRYPGHCEIMKAMLELGLGSEKPISVDGRETIPRSVFKEVLKRQLSYNGPDLVLVRITVEGEKDGTRKTMVYQIVDRQDHGTGLTAMMRCTAFPAAIIARMAASGQIAVRGVKPQEVAVEPALFLPQLKKRGINLTVTESE